MVHISQRSTQSGLESTAGASTLLHLLAAATTISLSFISDKFSKSKNMFKLWMCFILVMLGLKKMSWCIKKGDWFQTYLNEHVY